MLIVKARPHDLLTSSSFKAYLCVNDTFLIFKDSFSDKELQTKVKTAFIEKALKVIELVLNKKIFYMRLFKIVI